ncbi:Zinc finger, RING/FYVE/PHD-type [Artemisia annua]|uniref:RING-type E3 ubiquitin transferase n=1 Tax=Artemisia annua TaxID=35608 RepID=A0A2U1N5G4_ARTAN|nr:Zinc finger, RING/FYVE/PHD-type [Artemisia annua]
MAAHDRHRKLLEDLTNATSIYTKFCLSQCDPNANPTGLCFAECFPFCPHFCHAGGSSLSPSQSPDTSPYPLPPSGDPNTPLSLPLKISLVFIVSSFIYTLYKFYIWHKSRRPRIARVPFRENQENRDQIDLDVLDHPIWYIRTTGLQASVINGIKVVKYDKSDGVVDGTDCTVCMSEFEGGDMLRLLPNCKHAFHISCIDTWLQSHTNCPLCRAGVIDKTVDELLPERNNDDLRFIGETGLGVSSTRDDDDRGEASGSSEVRPGEEELNNNCPKIEG